MCNSGIYYIRSKINNTMYIGSAQNLSTRKKQHFTSLKRGTHHNKHLQNHYNKYGEFDLHFQILEFIPDKTKLIEQEQFYIDKFKIEYKLFNFCLQIPNSQLGLKRSEETKIKIGNKSRGRKHTDSTKQIISIKNSNPSEKTIQKRKNSRIGIKHSEETKEKIRVASKKHKHSEETKQRIREKHYGNKATLETKIKMSNSHKGNKNALGMKHTEEAKKKMSDASRKYWGNKKNDKLL